MSQEEAKQEEQVNGQVEQQEEKVEKVEDKPQTEEEPKKDEEAKEEGEITDNEGEGKETATEEEEAGSTPKVEVQGEDAPLTKILEQLDQLSESEQQVIKDNMERIATYPKELPLSQSWSESLPTLLLCSFPQN
jgi:hypothetical protein